MAIDSIDTEALQIEEDAQQIRAAELVKQFKLEMGVGDTSSAQGEPTLEVPEQEQEAGGKTIGKQRSKTD
jgi:phage shock protein A